ncbi:DUF5659 domain-containing protein [Domibacillus antri]|uniref:DUF5659 domain-containing protein n=1 Tax=Domibacillus antri TaxID=1714264 RepID=UPI00130100F8|nr:DUF5659 domain-containing protein [Domibacillus antri]
MEQKCVLSLRIARHLLARGFQLVDIEPSRKVRGQLVFVFAESQALNEEIASFIQNN